MLENRYGHARFIFSLTYDVLILIVCSSPEECKMEWSMPFCEDGGCYGM